MPAPAAYNPPKRRSIAVPDKFNLDFARAELEQQQYNGDVSFEKSDSELDLSVEEPVEKTDDERSDFDDILPCI